MNGVSTAACCNCLCVHSIRVMVFVLQGVTQNERAEMSDMSPELAFASSSENGFAQCMNP